MVSAKLRAKLFLVLSSVTQSWHSSAKNTENRAKNIEIMQKFALAIELEASAYEGEGVKKMVGICAAVSSTAEMAHG